MRELVIDNFAGGGGASTGIEAALGVSVDVAINHDAEAVAMHAANHPGTFHYTQKITSVNPLDVMPGRPIGLAWFSPDCKHFSKAKGAAPVEKNIRDLAWVVVAWAETRRPRVIILENVEEFTTWGPLMPVRQPVMEPALDADGRPLLDDVGNPVLAQATEDGEPVLATIVDKNGNPKFIPDPERKGETFREWVARLRKAGYQVEWRELRACDYGAPTIRKRLFVVARCDGQPIVWPEPTHGPGRPHPWRTAAECIDWELPCPSIFGRPKPLAEATLRRIARGIQRFVLEAAEPFIIPITHGGPKNAHNVRCNSVHEPLRTLTTQAEHALVAPCVMANNTNNVGKAITDPVPTVTTGGRNFLVAPYLAPRYQEKPGDQPRVRGADLPLATITVGAHVGHLVVPILVGCGGRAGQSRPRAGDEPTATTTAKADTCLVTPFLVPRYNEREGQLPRCQSTEDPLATITATANGARMCATFLAQHNGGMVGRPADEPLSTLTMTGSHQQLVSAHMEITRSGAGGQAMSAPANTLVGSNHLAVIATHLMKLYGTSTGQPMEQPLHTVTAGGWKHAEVRAFLQKYYKTAVGQPLNDPFHTGTTRDRFGLVTVAGQEYQIVDIGMRMLSPRELFRAQGFPDSYLIDAVGPDRKPLTKTAQIKMCGNSVCPPMAEAMVRANVQLRDVGEVVELDSRRRRRPVVSEDQGVLFG